MSDSVRSERYQARLRHADYFARELQSANSLYLTVGQVAQGLAQFDLERSNIDAAFEWLRRNLQVEQAAKLVVAYNTAQILQIRQGRTQRKDWAELAVLAASSLADPAEECRTLCALAVTLSNGGDNHGSARSYLRGLVIAHRTRNDTFERMALRGLSSVYESLGMSGKAKHYARRLVDFLEAGHTGAHLPSVLSDESVRWCALGDGYTTLGDSVAAVNAYREALAIERTGGNRLGELCVLGFLSTAHAAFGATEDAVRYSEQSMKVAREIRDDRREAPGLATLGKLYTAVGNTKKATAALRRALALDRKLGNRLGESLDLRRLAAAYDADGRSLKALDLLKQSVEIAGEVSDGHGEAVGLFASAELLSRAGDVGEAIAQLEKACVILTELRHPWLERASRLLEQLRGRSGSSLGKL